VTYSFKATVFITLLAVVSAANGSSRVNVAAQLWSCHCETFISSIHDDASLFAVHYHRQG